tara:strand:+ start:42222 stop:45743 length:3522 start_codon:yes stop_codon:yes gene_type:complete
VYISELKLHGFKSFAKKEVMKLGQGVTTVVGPNGCGKTNIVDAIRWVLGEQKYSVLRSGKMEDVIFNGAANVKPLGVCEVALTVHNNSGKLPIEYNDIEIARRVYRSGESEYFLNRTPCRLKDINELFVDTGMGADAYSVIELKMIEQILSETGEDRRKMFEEAAGINKYRHQRKRTIRRFEVTRMDLDRVNDIIIEVEQKVKNLSLQLKRYKRHESLTNSLEENDLSLAYLQVFRFKSMLSPLKKKIKDFNHLRENNNVESTKDEDSLKSLRITYKTQEDDINRMREKMRKIKEDRETTRNNILIGTEKGRSILLNIDRLERETINNNKKIGELKQLSISFDKEMTNLEPEIDSLIEAYKIEKEVYDKLESDYRKAEKKLDKEQSVRWEMKRKQMEERTLYDRTQALLDEKQNSLKKLEESLAESNIIKSSQIEELKKNDIEIESISKKILSNKKSHIKNEEKLTNLVESKHSLLDEKRNVSSHLEILKGQLDFYNGLIQTKEGFPEGTKFILENPKKFQGVLGTAADMFQIEPDLRDALESSLGDLSHCLIAENKKSALDTIKKANDLKAGNLTIIPLEEVSNYKLDLKPVPMNSRILGRVSDLITTGEQLIPLAKYLFGNILVVDNLQKSTSLKDLDGWGLVDKSGSYFRSDLVLKNRQKSTGGSMIGRKIKVESLKVEIKEINKKNNYISSQHDAIDKKISLLKIDIEKQELVIQELKKNLSERDSVNLKIQIQHEQLIISISNFDKSITENKIILRESKIALETLEPTTLKASNELKLIEENVEYANKDLLEKRSKRDKYHQNIQNLRIRLVEIESSRDNVKYKQSSSRKRVEELKTRQETISKEIEKLKQKKSNLDKNISIGEKDLQGVNAEVSKQRSVIDLKQTAYRDTFDSIEDIQTKIALEQKNREKILEELKNAELDVSEYAQKIKLVEERVLDRYGKLIEDEKIVDQTEDELKLNMDKIQRSIENIGPINMAVKHEHEEELDRLSILNDQREDLYAAENDLRETIQKIDRVARKRFQETFELIKSNFEDLFKLFFEGGSATLNLVGDPDALEADIGIIAQPPGKRNTSLRLLSSGEKALTAISLLFAIYQVKPSPYCILDEVDAPLDDVNIRKFTKVLQKFCNETQFIIVTHNKLTMEIADYMYGVTQERKGLSKLVSVKFD